MRIHTSTGDSFQFKLSFEYIKKNNTQRLAAKIESNGQI